MIPKAAPIDGRYLGEGTPIFRLAFITSLLTLLTLGIYRFWAKTRIRKYIWSSISFRGDTLEYTGTGLEKFLGFLVAIVILAVYLALVQMALFFFGMSMFTEPQTMQQAIAQIAATYITIFAVAPLWFFAIYRARRYKMARTRWRGIRFGMESGAWGYALRSIGYWILTVSTLGLLLPLQTFKLEKYMTDRSWYGNAQFEQQGDWKKLYGAMKHIFIGIGILALGVVFAAMNLGALVMVPMVVGYFWITVGFVYFRVRAFAYMAEHKALDGEVQFASNPSTGTVMKIVILGGIAIGVLGAIFFGIVGAFFVGTLAITIDSAGQPQFPLIGFVLLALAYAAALLSIGAMTLALITQPVIRHVVETLTIRTPEGLDRIRQRIHDEGADAEGFADALDVGGAI